MTEQDIALRLRSRQPLQGADIDDAAMTIQQLRVIVREAHELIDELVADDPNHLWSTDTRRRLVRWYLSNALVKSFGYTGERT